MPPVEEPKVRTIIGKSKKYNIKGDGFTLELRRKEVASLYAKGLKQWQIAEQLGISVATVSRDITSLRNNWKEQSKQDYEDRLADELAQLDHVQQEARGSWEKSKEIVKRVEGVWITIPNGRPGDIEYLKEMRSCIELRLKIMGALKGPTLNVNNLTVFDLLSGATSLPNQGGQGQGQLEHKPSADDLVEQRLAEELGEDEGNIIDTEVIESSDEQ